MPAFNWKKPSMGPSKASFGWLLGSLLEFKASAELECNPVSHGLRHGDKVNCVISELQPLRAEPEDIPLDIVYEDDRVLVLNKPPDMFVHPAPGNATGTLVNRILHHCSLPTVASSEKEVLSDAENVSDDEESIHQSHCGLPSPSTGRVEIRNDRDLNNRIRMVAVPGLSHHGRARHAASRYKVIEVLAGGGSALVQWRLETGRTHQIRAHAKYMGIPLLGDEVTNHGDQFPTLNRVRKGKKVLWIKNFGTWISSGPKNRSAWAEPADKRKKTWKRHRDGGNLTGWRRYFVATSSELQTMSEILKNLMEKKLPFMASTVAP
ncbi:RNA pseudourine synthase 2, chloroplastic, putative [Theobroma cacao]|uniref:RNA pseudourine synthase 2, chloroplastic, putative n=1 Tax=Theobroma cacao TaxID=3641 RepID=A0A061FDY5_THECC|nr:RNA pseudourine synthase 2, chloroplastic, putative [Theobroma cacao]